METLIKFLATDLIFIILLVIPFLFWQKKRAAAITGTAAAAFAWGITELVKNAVAAPRPYQVDLRPLLIPEPAGSSFPSGHTAVAAAIAAAVFIKEKRLGVSLGFLAILVGIGRIAAGAHFIADVVAGLILGVFIGFLTPVLLRAIPRKSSS